MSMRRYPSYLFRDPLLLPTYLDNNRTGTPIILTNTIDINVEGDHLLNLYITQLDNEIYQNIPEGLGDVGEAMWMEDNWSELAPQIADAIRKHGWCMIQFYEDGDFGRWKVFTVNEFADWIKEPNKDGKIVRKGAKFSWADDLGNSWTNEELRFEDDNTFLVKWREGRGLETFAFPDLSQAIMTLAFEFRQMRGQLTFSASKPSFKHFKYGPDANNDNIDDLDTKIKGIDTSSAIGAPITVLDSIDTIEDKTLSIIEPALDKQLQYYAGVTRLPVSYYMGERSQSSGMNGKGDTTDLLKIRQKKELIFNTISPSIVNMFSDVYDISIDELELPEDESLEEVETDSDPSETATNATETVKETDIEE